MEEGASTDDIDAKVHDAIVSAGAYPSPLGYRGFPKSIAVAPNEVICHGIPDSRILEDGLFLCAVFLVHCPLIVATQAIF